MHRTVWQRRSCSRMVAKSAGRTPQSTSVASHSLHLSYPLVRVALLKFQAPAGVGSHEKKPKQFVWQVLLLQNNYTIKFKLEIELFRNSK